MEECTRDDKARETTVSRSILEIESRKKKNYTIVLRLQIFLYFYSIAMIIS